ncbi:hypothetical protein BGZ59_000191 [Podila verticillata]|nr:hypothetical protein BGZ59_000191 [Podila verticillata]
MSHLSHSQEQAHEEERRPFAAQSSSPSSSPRHPRSPSSSPTYQAVDKSRPNANTTASDPAAYESDSDSETNIDSSSSSSPSRGQTTPLVQDTPSEETLSISEATGSHRNHHHHHHRPHRSPLRRRVTMLLATLSQIGLFIFFGALAGAVVKAPLVYPYSWHPICMGLYGFVATEAILILQPVEKGSQKRLARTIHGLVQILAMIFSLLGFTAIYVNKDLLGKEHFHTNHALFGCTTVFIFFLQVLFGCFVGYAPRSVLQWIGQARIVRIHRIAGYVSIALLWITLWLGVLTNWMVKNFDHSWIFALGLGMLAVGLVGQITPSRLVATRKTVRTVSP